MELQEWIRANLPDPKYFASPSWESQVCFFRDRLARVVGVGLTWEEFEAMKVAHVIGAHMSKSVTFPVVELRRPDIGLRIILRNNLHDWKMTYLGPAVAADFEGLFEIAPKDPKYKGPFMSSCYFEGFPEGLVRGHYSANNAEWSAEIGSGEEMYTALFLIMRALGARRMKVA